MAQTKLEVIGLGQLKRRFQNVARAQSREVAAALEEAAINIRNHAAREIQTGAKTGRVYETRFWTDSGGRLRIGDDRPRHQASAPGEFPATDTGTLVGSIDFRLKRGRTLMAEVGTDLDYGIWLEFGTQKMEARPWL
jgi:hypothetical protein